MAQLDIAIDLGTANTLVYVRGRGIVVSEPSVVAMDTVTGTVHAVGEEAKRMIGRTPATISATRPLRHGVIADFEITEEMLRYFIRRVHRGRLSHPRVIVCAPSGITEVEKKAVVDASMSAGARQVHLIEEPIAAAIGAGLPIAEPTGHLVVDVGGGTSEVAVITLGEMAVSRSVRVGGYDFDEALMQHLRRTHHMAIGQPTAEQLKFELGSAWPMAQERQADVRGRDLVSGLPKTVVLTSEEVREVCEEPLGLVIGAVKETLEATPPELASDIGERGILLAGGGSLLTGFEQRLREETGMPAVLAESPLTCVAEGAGRSLEEVDTLERTKRGVSRPRFGRRRTSLSR
ncbi:MAG: rod shape-determining protein MreB [Microbacteriaceae bacterium]|nr:rod shape-determining protein MreB [Microbacteriaceae bacterium]